MPANPRCAALSAIFLSVLACRAAPAGEPKGSALIFLAPAKGVPGRIYTGDLAPSQVLEIIRPETVAITVSRLSTSCTCLAVGVEKKTFDPGERAFVEVRNVKPTPPAGATYMVFVELTGPARELLTYDLFVKSGFPGNSGESERVNRRPPP